MRKIKKNSKKISTSKTNTLTRNGNISVIITW